MTKIIIIYASNYGNTKKMAETIEKGVKSVDQTETELLTPEMVNEDHMVNADGIIVGSPVHMGSPDWQIKKFIDTVCSKLWLKDKLVGKVGGVFASGGGYGSAGGGCELTMLALLNNLVELGLIIVPLPKNTPGYELGGLQWGPYGRSADIHGEHTGVSEENMKASFSHGANIARVAKVLKGSDLFAKSEMAHK